MKDIDVKRRDFLKYAGICSTGLVLGTQGVYAISGNDDILPDTYRAIHEAVYKTPIVDAHEHLYDEKDRIGVKSMISKQCNDWSILLNHYLNNDLSVSGMSDDDYKKFFSPEINPAEKWKYLATSWQRSKFTGYARAVLLTIKELYDIDDIDEKSVPLLQRAYESLIKPGFYKRVLQLSKANIESCQVDPLTEYPVLRSEYPDFLMSDLKANSFISNPGRKDLAQEAGIVPAKLTDWHKVIDFWFNRYSKYVVAIKISLAYSRRVDFEPTKAEKVLDIYDKIVQGQSAKQEEKKALEDHLFWYVVNKATEFNLPVKIHLGYHAGQNSMNLENVSKNPSDAAMLCRQSKKTRFVFFHISYPYYEEMLAVAKHYSNAYVDMCWSWIINPVSAKEFLKKFIVTVPYNKLIVFGGDYRIAESTVGHAILARDGIAQALNDLVKEGHIGQNEALGLAEPLLRGNCHEIFDIKAKTSLLRELDWNKV